MQTMNEATSAAYIATKDSLSKTIALVKMLTSMNDAMESKQAAIATHLAKMKKHLASRSL